MNLVEGLSRQITRVSEMKQDAMKMAGVPQVSHGLLRRGRGTRAIEEGHQAMGSGDILRMKPAYETLAEIQ